MKNFFRSVVQTVGSFLALCALGTLGILSWTANHHPSSASASEPQIPMEKHVILDQSGDIGISGFAFGGGAGVGKSGGGGFNFTGHSQVLTQPKEIVLNWEKPNEPLPTWLAARVETNEPEEHIRASLNKSCEINFNAMPLSGVMKVYRSTFDIPIVIDDKALEEASLSPDEPVTLELPPTQFRDSLSLILRPLNLTYIIDKGCLIITAGQGGCGALRYYDLSHFMPDNSLTSELISTIQTMILPTNWEAAGGNYSIRSVGSVLVVRADEESNFEIEGMLRAISKQTPANLKARVYVDKPVSETTDKAIKNIERVGR